MWGTLTIISAADTTLMSTIFNGVAIICSQTNLIFSIAFLASIIKIFITLPALLISGGNPAVFRSGVMSILIAMVLAVLLTDGSFKSSVQIENNATGQVTLVDNVPVVISAVPAGASSMATEIGTLVQQAFQGANSQWSLIGGNGQGLMMPLKALLGARTAIQRTGKVNSDFSAVVSSCISADVGNQSGAITNAVMNAGNPGGATAASVIQVTPFTDMPTSAGALLWYAAQNTTGVVPSMLNPGDDIPMSCADAATYVAQEINSALSSPALSQVLTSAVTGSDNPNNVQKMDFTTLGGLYNGVRLANASNSTLLGGQSQAYAELVNLMMYQTVKDNLGCLNSPGQDKTQCMASMLQTATVEASNLDNAANAQVFTTLAGQFANFMLALIIGLGPIIIIFMMFAGVSAGKNIKIAVHMVVWPMLIYNVGVVLINGMIYATVANFMQTLSWGSFITQANAGEVYRHFSMEIGTASALMASLPILMSTVFALGESAAWVSIANTAGGKDRYPEGDVTGTKGMANLSPNTKASYATGNGGVHQELQGSVDPSAVKQQQGITRALGESFSDTQSLARSIQSGHQTSNALNQVVSSGDGTSMGWSQEQARDYSNKYNTNMQVAANAVLGAGTTGLKAGADMSAQVAWAQAKTLGDMEKEGSSFSKTQTSGTSWSDAKSSVQSYSDSLNQTASQSHGYSESLARQTSLATGYDTDSKTVGNHIANNAAIGAYASRLPAEIAGNLSTGAQSTFSKTHDNVTVGQHSGAYASDSTVGANQLSANLAGLKAVANDPKSSTADVLFANQKLFEYGQKSYGMEGGGSGGLANPGAGNYNMGGAPSSSGASGINQAQVQDMAHRETTNKVGFGTLGNAPKEMEIRDPLSSGINKAKDLLKGAKN